MKKIITSTLVLCIITLVAGLCLAVVYEVTKEPIAAAEEKAALAAYQSVFPSADVFETQELAPIPPDASAVVEKVAVAKQGSEALGWALTVTSHEGYGGDITIAMGVSPDGTLTGISVISQGETAGLGAKCKDTAFTDRFVGISGGRITLVKTEAAGNGQVQAISGATVTSTAVVNAVNTGLSYVYEQYLGGLQQPAEPSTEQPTEQLSEEVTGS